MRILLTTDCVGGVWEYTATLARALVAEGHSTLVAVIGAPSDEQLEQLPAEAAVERRLYRLEWMADSEPEISPAAEWLAEVSDAWGADLVHLNQMTYSGAAHFSAPTLVVSHSDVHSWFSETRGTPPPPEWRPYRRRVVTGLRAATSVVAPSRYQAGLLEKHYRIGGVQVIHNGVDLTRTPRRSEDSPLLITAGRAWDEAKGIHTLDEALERLGPPLRAHLLGPLEGPLGDRYLPRRLAAEGRVAEATLRDWMARATIYVAPSRYEPFGLAPLEAAGHGCALVLSDIGSFRELWDGCALFFAPGDASSLARALERLLGDPVTREALGEAARARAFGRYDERRFVADYLRHYRTLLDVGPRTRAWPVRSLTSRETTH